MLPIITLDSKNGSQATSVGRVSVLTGEENVWLFIYNGIALNKQFSDDDFWGNTQTNEANVSVLLDNLQGMLLEWSCLATPTIWYVDDSLCDVGINDTWIEYRPNGDLLLWADAYAAGPTGHAGFSYQANIKMRIDAASISGRVRWHKDLALPLNPPYLRPQAVSQGPPPPGGFNPLFTLEATGVESALVKPTASDPHFYVPYEIKGTLLGKTLSVAMQFDGSRFNIIAPNVNLVINQISGPAWFTLTTANPHQTHVDFEIGGVEPPH